MTVTPVIDAEIGISTARRSTTQMVAAAADFPATSTSSGDSPTLWAILAVDDGHWMALAAERGLRLPHKETPCTTGRMERWLHKLGWTSQQFTDWCGHNRLGDWIAANPGWNLRAFVGLLLEEA